MYGLTFTEMLFVWVAVSMLIGGGVLLLSCIVVGLTPKRPQYFPQPQAMLGSEQAWTDEDREAFYPLIDQLADEGEYELWRDADIGKTYPLPRDRRAA